MSKRKNNIFQRVPMLMPKQSRFDLSHDVKMSFSMGELVPTLCMEVLPGDKISISPQNMLRFAPLIAPVMHRVRVKSEFFFVPNRLLWSDWERWITNNSDVAAPYISLVGGASDKIGTNGDYLGYPTQASYDDNLRATPLPLAALCKIYDEWYRDENLVSEVFVPLVPGNNPGYKDILDAKPFRRAWEHDYFTSCLPFAQKGDAVQLPLTFQNDVPVDFQTNEAFGGATFMRDPETGNVLGAGDVVHAAGPAPFANSVHVDGNAAAYDPNGTLSVDIQSGAVDINTVRYAFRLQEWLEKMARGGSRYVESLLSHFGVRSSDARLQRPEFLGSFSQNMVISEVLATAQSSDDVIPVGQMAGHGISVGGGNISFRAEEHGYIIGIISVIPDTSYQQGLHRSLSRFDRLDYAWPTFANIGEQEVFNKEIMAASSNPNGIFGYIPRYSEYRFMNSRVSGEFRDTLQFWHLGRIFPGTATPLLNDEFITADPSTRIFAVTDEDEDHIFAHIFLGISAVRKLPRHGIPTI